MAEFFNRQWRLPNNENKDKQSNYSMDFDGASETISLNTSTISFAGSFSISMWINPSSLSGFQMLFSGSGYSGGNGIAHYIYNNTVKTYVSVSGSYTQIFQSSALLNIGSWIHIIIQREKGTKWEMWIDGVLEETNTSARLTGDLTSANSTIAKHYNSTSNNFDGKIDAFSIFNYSLSSSQITTLYGSSSTGIGNPMSLSPKPVAYYPLGDQDAFNGANYLVPNSSLKDYVFDFDGSSGYINLNFQSQTTPATISMWVNTDVNDSQQRYAIINGRADQQPTVYLRMQSDNTYQVFISNTNGFDTLQGSSATINTWFHFAIVCENSQTLLYENGVLKDSSTIGWNGIDIDQSNNWQLGRDSRGQRYWNGKISNTQIFNSALPATGSNSVETLYNNGSPLTSMSGFTSLQGWWKLDASATYDSSTTTWSIPDDSTNSNTGTSSGMTQANLVQSDLSFKTSISPFALNFDGANDYIDCGNLQPSTTSLSISAWAYKTDATNASIIGRGASVDFNISTYSGSLMFGLNSGSWSTIAISNFTNNYLNKWFHVCATWDGFTMKLYLNGNEEASASKTGTITYTSNDTTIGKNSTLSGYEWDGKISNVSLWNAGLTSSQVTEIYSEGIPQNLNNHSAVSSLVSWWQLGSNSSFNTNWTILDEKGSNNGTSSNMGEDAIVDGVGSYANGLSSGMGGDEVIGDAPYSTANALSVNMDVLDRVTDTPS